MIRGSFRRRVHASWLIGIIAGGVLLGVAVSLLLPSGILAGGEWLVFALLLLPIIFTKPIRAMVILALVCGIVLGMWRGSVQRVELGGYRNFLNHEVVLRGKVAEDVPRAANGTLELRVGEVEITGQRLPGQIWVSATSRLEVKRSDTVTLKGVLKPGFGTFPGSMSYAKVARVERPALADPARDVRDTFSSAVREGIPEPEASLGIGYLTGQRSTLPPDLEEQLRLVGLTHVVVASGYNLTILVRFARRLFAKVSKYMAAASAGFMIAGFVLVTGFSPSMSRAGLVAGLSLAAWYYGRNIHPMVLLPFTAAITLLVNPMYAWGDLGWYLSFLSFAGVIILAPLIHEYFWGSKKPGIVRQLVIDTMSAQVVTFPILALAFGEYSPYALLANLLVLPLIPLTMVLTFITGVVGLLAPQLATMAGAPADGILSYMTSAVRWVAELPGAQGELAFGVPALVVSYGVMLLVAIYLWRATGHSFRRDNVVE